MLSFFKQKFTSILLVATFLVGAVLSVNFAPQTEAASQTAGDLIIEYPSEPLFNAQNIVPGYEEVKTITVTNNGTVPHQFSLALSGAVGDLAQVIHFEPRNFDTKTPYWNHTLSEIVASENGFAILTPINPGETVKIDLAAILPADIGNEYQGKSVTTFGIIFGVDAVFEDHAIPIFGPTDGGDIAPLIYGGRRIGLVGPSGIGSREPAIEPTAEQPQETEIAGEQTETKGEETSSKKICFWWWLLLIVYGVFLALWGYLTKIRQLLFAWFWTIFAGTVIYLVHWILHNWWTPSKYCPYFIWFELILLVVYFIVMRVIENYSDND